MNISGIIVRALPENCPYVKEQMLALPGIEIPVEHEDGRMVVIIDEKGKGRAGEALMKIQNITGVLSANLVYQHAEDDSADDDQPIEIPAEKLDNIEPEI